ncbi:MAG TPA: acyl-CoA dehydrogenase family protein [Acidimicrobiales bacterium]|nr:acyl-CoA dehydrogenase family protein [Acidimicrobiales bacterium]
MPPMPDPADLLDLANLYSPEEQLVAQTVRRFVGDRVMPVIEECYEAGRFPTELVREIGALGLFGMLIPDEEGVAATPTAYGLACLELEAGDSGLRSFVSVQGSLAMHAIATFGSADQRAEWLPGLRSGALLGCFGLTEPDAGSDPGAMRTRARRVDGDYVLDGAKLWITNGSIADVAVVWAQTDEGIRGFLVPKGTPGFTASDIHHKLSMRASITSALSFDQCRLPASALLGGASGLRGPLSCLNEARFGIIFGVLGAARSCLETALSYAAERQVFGRPLSSFQLTQAKLAAMATHLSTATLLAGHLGRLKQAGTIRPDQISLGKLNNVRAALDIARQARTILGGNGITLDYGVMRHVSNLETVLTYEGTEEVHLLSVGRALTGESAFS